MHRTLYGHNFTSRGPICTNKDVLESSENNFFILLCFEIQGVIRGSELRHNTRYKLTTLSMKLDPTLSILGCLMGI